MASFSGSRPFERIAIKMATSGRGDIASLRDENERLRVQLKSCDLSRRRAERQTVELQTRVHQAEAAAAEQLRLKEAEWMAEYDCNVQALLKIIEHHEDEKTQLKVEVQELQAAAVVPPSVTTMTRSTQTEMPRPVKGVQRRNSVRFATEEDDAASDNEERIAIDAKAKSDIARMQHLFEQLQVPLDQPIQRDSKSVDRPVKKNLGPGLPHHCKEHRSPEPSCSFKEAVLRPGENRTEVSTIRWGRAAISESRRKSTETQTQEMPVPKQEISSTALQQDLEERNRLLHERLTSQQKVLDQFLYTKLNHASASAEQRLSDHKRSSPCIPSDVVIECVGNGQGEAQRKYEYRSPTTDPAACLTQNGDVHIESALDTTERRPLSPAAA